MMTKFMGNLRILNSGTLSLSKSSVDIQSGAMACFVEGQPVETYSLPKAGIVIETNDVSLDKDPALKDLAKKATKSTSNTVGVRTKIDKSLTCNSEVLTIIEIVELTDSFLELENVGGSVANEDLVAVKALGEISSPRCKVEAYGNNGNLKVAFEGKETSISKEVPLSICDLFNQGL